MFFGIVWDNFLIGYEGVSEIDVVMVLCVVVVDMFIECFLFGLEIYVGECGLVLFGG